MIKAHRRFNRNKTALDLAIEMSKLEKGNEFYHLVRSYWYPEEYEHGGFLWWKWMKTDCYGVPIPKPEFAERCEDGKKLLAELKANIEEMTKARKEQS